MDVNKIKLLLCSSDQIHTKTSQIKIYKEKLNQSFETTFFDVFSYFKLYGRSETEKYIKNIINKFQVLIITTDKPYYSFDFFNNLKKINSNLIIVYTDGDAILNFPGYSINFVNDIDLFAITDSIKVVNFLKERNKKSIFFYTQFKEDFHKLENRNKTKDVIFYGGKKTREKHLEYIEKNNIKLNLYGRGFHGFFTNISELNKNINESKIGLSINLIKPELKWFETKFNEWDKSIHVKGKNFEIPLCGTFLLTEYLEDLDELYNNKKEAVFFNDKREMVDLIKYYLNKDDKREEIALAGYKRALSYYEGSKMLDKLINEIKEIFKNKEYKAQKKISYKRENNRFVCWSLNYAIYFLKKKNFKALFDMLKVIKLGIPSSYIIFKLKVLLINIIIFLKSAVSFKKK